MKTIWKAVIDITDEILVPVRKGAAFLTVMKQGNDLCVWFEVDPNAEPETKQLFCFGTGQLADLDKYIYINSVIDGQFVWHFYQSFGSGAD